MPLSLVDAPPGAHQDAQLRRRCRAPGEERAGAHVPPRVLFGLVTASFWCFWYQINLSVKKMKASSAAPDWSLKRKQPAIVQRKASLENGCVCDTVLSVEPAHKRNAARTDRS